MKNRFSLLILCALFLSFGCDGTNLFDQLESSTVNVVIKGTFESNDPVAWKTDTTDIDDDSMTYVYPEQARANRPDQSAAAAAGVTVDPGISSYDTFPTEFKFDVAKMSINGDNFANSRKIYNCSISDTDPFFDGTGVDFPATDVEKNKRYTQIEMYIRKMMFNSANEYTITDGNAGFIRSPVVNFNEGKHFGYDVNQDYVWAFWDNLRQELTDINRVFPLAVPISDSGISGVSGFKTDDARTSVLEIRFLVKNYIKRFEVVRYDDVLDSYASFHVFGLSDWLRDIRPYRSEWLGGNILTVARAYFPDSVGSISGTVGAASAGAVVIAIPDEQAADPAVVTTLDSNDYAEEIIYDATAHTIGSSAVSGLHGFYEYSNRYDVADSYGTGSLSPANYNTSTDLTFEEMNYYLEYQRYCYDYYYEYFGSVMNSDPTYENTFSITNNISGSTVEYDDYGAVWDRYNKLYNNFRLPPLATSVQADGTYTLKNVPVGKTYRLYISTQSAAPSSASPAVPSAAVLPYGWKPSAASPSVTISSPGSIETADF